MLLSHRSFSIYIHRRTDGLGIRRIRIMQRNVPTSGSIPTTKVVIPQEIDILNTSQLSYAITGLEFAQATDKENTIHARFDIKCDRSSTSVDISPPLAELLIETKQTWSVSKFDETIQKSHGIHQQVKCKIELSSLKKASSIATLYQKLPSKILKVSTLVSSCITRF